jgi:hypothetical protein
MQIVEFPASNGNLIIGTEPSAMKATDAILCLSERRSAAQKVLSDL